MYQNYTVSHFAPLCLLFLHVDKNRRPFDRLDETEIDIFHRLSVKEA